MDYDRFSNQPFNIVPIICSSWLLRPIFFSSVMLQSNVSYHFLHQRRPFFCLDFFEVACSDGPTFVMKSPEDEYYWESRWCKIISFLVLHLKIIAYLRLIFINFMCEFLKSHMFTFLISFFFVILLRVPNKIKFFFFNRLTLGTLSGIFSTKLIILFKYFDIRLKKINVGPIISHFSSFDGVASFNSPYFILLIYQSVFFCKLCCAIHWHRCVLSIISTEMFLRFYNLRVLPFRMETHPSYFSCIHKFGTLPHYSILHLGFFFFSFYL